ncbi:hypothetical protein EXIGLDRAFT_728756, partial [Exidia glandulosa HHB12029]
MSSVVLDSGVTFEYKDSGVPTNSGSYDTVITLHGLAFESGIFARLTPFSAGSKLRVISLNRRGYTGSSPYTEEEVAVIQQGDDAARGEFLVQQGIDLARAIVKLIRTLELSVDGSLAVLSWSLGNIWLHALLVSIDHVEEGERSTLEAFISHIIFLDPASQGLGIPDPVDSWNAYKQPDYPPIEALKYTSGFYTHDLSARKLEYRQWDSDPKPTTESMQPDELAGVLNGAASVHDGGLAVPAFEPLLKALAQNALLKAVPERWHRLQKKVHVVYGERTLWMCIYALWIMEDWASSSSLDIEAHVLD